MVYILNASYAVTTASVPFEKLHLAFMLFGGFKAGKRAQVAPLARCILLARIDAKLSRFEFANHAPCDAAVMVQVAPPAGFAHDQTPDSTSIWDAT
jgi:hypothetical protein